MAFQNNRLHAIMKSYQLNLLKQRLFKRIYDRVIKKKYPDMELVRDYPLEFNQRKWMEKMKNYQMNNGDYYWYFLKNKTK